MLTNYTLNDPKVCDKLIRKLDTLLDRPLRFMEVCGTHTVSIFKGGIKALLPENVTHLTGPGCPVCVTHESEIAVILELAYKENVIIATFGDLIRVPGPEGRSLKHAQADGVKVSVIYSPMDILQLAADNPNNVIVFPAIGFETTAPTIAATILMAEKQQLNNIAILSCHKLVPPALEALLADPNCNIDGFLLPGHVSTVIGLSPYLSIVEKWKKPAVVGGFEPVDILYALCIMVEQLQLGEYTVKNAYPRAVHVEGNRKARDIVDKVFKVADAQWRGLDTLPMSGLSIRDKYKNFDALERFNIALPKVTSNPDCLCGDILKGKRIPPQCLLFGTTCTPIDPIGPCMVSTEGSCAAYFKYNIS